MIRRAVRPSAMLCNTGLRLLMLLGALALLAAPAQAQNSQEILLHEASGTTIRIQHIFSEVPPSGGTALQITLVNRLNEPLEVNLSTESGGNYYNNRSTMQSGGISVSAPAAATVTREWVVPLTTTAGGWQELRVMVGSRLRSSSVQFTSEPVLGVPFTAFSAGLAGRNIQMLQEEMTRRRNAARAAAVTASSSSYHHTTNGKFAARYEPGSLPSDWRALSGLDVLALSADEWWKLPEPVQLAVCQYIFAGGQLDLYHTGEKPQGILSGFGLQAEQFSGGDQQRAGAGAVRLLVWDGNELEATDITPYDGEDIPQRAKLVNAALLVREPVKPGEVFRKNLQDLLGSRSFAAWQVGVILLMFGIVVGPVNLFYLAGQGRRHRLFYTTPLISLGAAAVLVAVIFMQDGSGGDGRRAALVHLRAGENTAYVKQYQVSRTGVLFGGGFQIPPTAQISPLVLPESRWTRLKPSAGYHSSGQPQRFTAAASGECSGDFFQSRSEQAQLLEAVQPFRGRLEKRAAPGSGGAPVLISGFGFRLETLFYQDAAGKWWTAPDAVASGAETELQPATLETMQAWMEEALAVFPLPDRERLQSALRPGVFLASAADATAGLIPTLSSIRWTEDRVILHGPVAETP